MKESQNKKEYILVLNSGSTVIKSALFRRDGENIERRNFETKKELFSYIEEWKNELDRIGMRIVHAGNFCEPSKIDDKVFKKIHSFRVFAPIHNEIVISLISGIRALNLDIPLYGVFDTEFHKTIPEIHRTYLIKKDLIEEYGIRKYGFHGIALESAMNSLGSIYKERGKSFPKKIICAHLGGGCSITGIKNKKSFISSMEMSPLSGIPMITRSGSIDPSIYYILFENGYTPEEINRVLNDESGFYGFVGTKDTKDIFEKAKNGELREKLAFDIFVSEIVQRISAYAVLLGGMDTLVFTGGIGYGNEYLRKNVIEKILPFFQLEDSSIHALEVDEEEVIYRKIVQL